MENLNFYHCVLEKLCTNNHQVCGKCPTALTARESHYCYSELEMPKAAPTKNEKGIKITDELQSLSASVLHTQFSHLIQEKSQSTAGGSSLWPHLNLWDNLVIRAFPYDCSNLWVMISWFSCYKLFFQNIHLDWQWYIKYLHVSPKMKINQENILRGISCY